MAMSLAQDSQAEVDGDVDQTTVRGRALLAVSLAEDGQTDVDWHIDQSTITTARRNLITLGASKSSDTSIDRNIDQAIGGALLLALDISEDGGTKPNWHADQAFSGLNSLYNKAYFVSCTST